MIPKLPFLSTLILYAILLFVGVKLKVKLKILLGYVTSEFDITRAPDVIVVVAGGDESKVKLGTLAYVGSTVISGSTSPFFYAATYINCKILHLMY